MFGTLESILQNANQVKDFTKDGKCAGCGECCGDFLPLSQVEIDKIKAYVRKHQIREQINLVMDSPINFKCPFRDDTKRICTIYEVRPEICRCFMCNEEKAKLRATKELLHQKNRPISMRGEFFGNEINRAYLAFLMGGLFGKRG